MEKTFQHKVMDEQEDGGIVFMKISVKPERKTRGGKAGLTSQNDETKEEEKLDEQPFAEEEDTPIAEVGNERNELPLREAMAEDPIRVENNITEHDAGEDEQMPDVSLNSYSTQTKKKKKKGMMKFLKSIAKRSSCSLGQSSRGKKTKSTQVEQEQNRNKKQSHEMEKEKDSSEALEDDSIDSLLGRKRIAPLAKGEDMLSLKKTESSKKTDESPAPDANEEDVVDDSIANENENDQLDDKTSLGGTPTTETNVVVTCRSENKEPKKKAKKMKDKKSKKKSQQGDQLYSSILKVVDPAHGLTNDELAVVADEFRDEQNQLQSSILKAVDPTYDMTEEELATAAKEYRDEQNQLYSSTMKILDPDNQGSILRCKRVDGREDADPALQIQKTQAPQEDQLHSMFMKFIDQLMIQEKSQRDQLYSSFMNLMNQLNTQEKGQQQQDQIYSSFMEVMEKLKIQEEGQQDQLYSSLMKIVDPTHDMTEDEIALAAKEYRNDQNQLYSSAMKIIDPLHESSQQNSLDYNQHNSITSSSRGVQDDKLEEEAKVSDDTENNSQLLLDDWMKLLEATMTDAFTRVSSTTTDNNILQKSQLQQEEFYSMFIKAMDPMYNMAESSLLKAIDPTYGLTEDEIELVVKEYREEQSELYSSAMKLIDPTYT